MEFAGNAESPIFNPALVVQGWGQKEARLKIDGADVPRGPGFRYGHRRKLDSTDLIVWIKAVAVKPLRIVVTAVP